LIQFAQAICNAVFVIRPFFVRYGTIRIRRKYTTRTGMMWCLYIDHGSLVPINKYWWPFSGPNPQNCTARVQVAADREWGLSDYDTKFPSDSQRLLFSYTIHPSFRYNIYTFYVVILVLIY